MQRTGVFLCGRWFFGFGVLFWVFAFPNLSFGYDLKTDQEGTPLYWKEAPTLFWAVDPEIEDDGRLEEAIAEAVSAWADFTPNRVQASMRRAVDFEPAVYEGERPCPGKNCIVWSSRWPWKANQLSMTFLTFAEPGGQIEEADIVVNGENIDWSENGFDLANTLAHEIGHLYGMAHSEETEATMYALSRIRETKKRTLHADDVAGVQSLYGVGRLTVEPAKTACSQGSGLEGLALAFLLLALARRR